MLNDKEIELLRLLSEESGPSGNEERIRSIIKKQIADYVDTITTDPMGNLIAKVGESNDIVIMAHMDEVGMMVTKIEEDGAIRFQSIGGISPSALPSKRVRFHKNSIKGVVSAQPIHFTRNKNEDKKYLCSDLLIQIGTNTRSETEKYISIGDAAVFDSSFEVLVDEKRSFLGKALDNRLGCFLLIRAIQNSLFNDCTFVFTVQEENGLRGAHALLLKHSFQFGIALDTTTANDLPGVVGAEQVCHRFGGGVVSFIDGATVYDRDMVMKIFEEAKRKKIPLQTKTKKAGGNEASALQKCGLGCKAVSLSVPCRYIHGAVGLVSEKDIEDCYAALFMITNMRLGGKI
jgi:endoglucanase